VGRTALARFDLDTGERTGWFEPVRGEAPRWFGDVTIASDGTAFTTDSQGGGLYRISPDAEEIEEWVPSGTFPSPQGLVLSQDDALLFVADYARGIATVDTGTGEVSFLAAPINTSILGIDGLYRHGQSLIAIQNGILPHRVIRIGLSDSGRALTSVETLLANHPQFAEPTLGVVDDDALIFVANSQWFEFDAAGALPPATELVPPVILRLDLGRAPGD